MDNNENGDFNYVQEKVKPRTKKRIRKALIIAGGTLAAAVVFGFVARLVFTVSEGPVNKLLGITPAPVITLPPVTPVPRSQVKLTSPATETTPTTVPVLTPSAAPDGTPVDVVTLQPIQTPPPAEGVTSTPSDIPVTDTENPENNPDDEDINNQNDRSPLAAYLEMMSELKRVAATASESILKVYSVTTGVNWMDESIETRTGRTGIILADNGVELLVLTDYQFLTGADRIELQFADDTVLTAQMFSFDADMGFAVVSIPLEVIDEKTKETYTYAVLSNEPFGEGEPVIAIGRPNGYFGAVEYGFITHSGTPVYFTDGAGSCFTTDMSYGNDSDAVIVSLDGIFLGVVRPSDASAIDISSYTTLLEKLLNGATIPYFGIRAENIPANVLSNLELTHGIYVNEAISLSPAAEAGLKKGDIITGIDDIEITNVSEFYANILAGEEGTAVTVHIYRSSKREEPSEDISVVLSHK